MIETITPAVCGGRKRHRIALAAFTSGAVGASALLGAALGLVGAALGARQAVLAAAALAALAALREVGLVRLPLPQARLQVPERWHFELPLPVWSAGYGAGLGVGFATYQPVATFWVACVAALALGRPITAALVFALYGVGRSLMVILPARSAERSVAVDRLARGRPKLKRANAIALATCAVLLAAAPAAGAQPLPLGPGSQLDPSISRGVLAYTQRDPSGSGVLVRVSDVEMYAFPDARSPSLDGELLAYSDANGVRIVRWRTGAEVTRVPAASRPALDWPWLVYRLDTWDGYRELWLSNLSTGERLLVTRVSSRADLGRPSVSGGRVAWHVATQNGSRIGLYTIATRFRRILARSRIALLAYPAVSGFRVVWVEQRSRLSSVRVRRIDTATVTTLAESWSRTDLFWTTALSGRTAYFTRWIVGAGFSQIERVRF